MDSKFYDPITCESNAKSILRDMRDFERVLLEGDGSIGLPDENILVNSSGHRAVAEATLALAQEQRTANIIALYALGELPAKNQEELRSYLAAYIIECLETSALK